jgi:CheY-like chemotaxis protein
MSKRILLADDDDDARSGLATLLEGMGYDVALAHSGAEALEVAARFRPRVAIVALDMPELNGTAAARQLRAQSAGRALLLIALTGWGSPQQRDPALTAGFDVHLVKPVSIDQLNFILSMVGN